MASSKQNSVDEKVKLPVTETISRFYQPRKNRKAIRILTVAVYVLCVSLAAIMLSLYYIFIWDPTIKPFMTKIPNCDKIIIPENIAIRLVNSTDITAEQFYKILQNYTQAQFQTQQNYSSFNNTLLGMANDEIVHHHQHIFSRRRKNYRKRVRLSSMSYTLSTVAPTTTTTRIVPPLKKYQRKYLMRINKDDEDEIEEDQTIDGSGQFIVKEESTESDLS